MISETAEQAARIVRIGPGAARYAAAIFSIGIAGWFLYESLPFLPPPPGQSDVGPGAVPALASVLLAGAGIWLALWRSPASDDAQVEEPARVLGAFILLLAFVLGLASPSLNAWVVIGGFILALQITLGERRGPILLIGTSLLLGTIWLLFGHVLGVPL